MVFLVLYVDNILFRNNVGVLTLVKVWLAKWFDMKDLGESNYVLRSKSLKIGRNYIPIFIYR